MSVPFAVIVVGFAPIVDVAPEALLRSLMRPLTVTANDHSTNYTGVGYAGGNGVKRNDYEAFKFYSQVVRQGVDQGSVESAYVSDALVEIADYIRAGIPGTPVKADPSLAQEYYRDAAINYRNPQAQFELGRMFLIGEGVKSSVKQAGRWLQLAAEKGHAGAQATLGNLLYQRGKVVRGLAMMTAALERATPPDRPWIFIMQEEAFSLASEADRRTAVALAQDMLAKGR